MRNTKSHSKFQTKLYCFRETIWKTLKTLSSSNYPTIQYFLLKLCSRFLLTNVYKKLCLDLELFVKIKKDLFLFLLITQDMNKIKKSWTPFFKYYYAENVCKISAKNIKFYGSWSSSKFSIFQTKKTGFLEIIDLCLNLGIGFCITWLVLPNYKEISP